MKDAQIDEKMDALLGAVVALRATVATLQKDHEREMKRLHLRLHDLERRLQIAESPVRLDNVLEELRRDDDDEYDSAVSALGQGITRCMFNAREQGQESTDPTKRKRGRPRKVRPV